MHIYHSAFIRACDRHLQPSHHPTSPHHLSSPQSESESESESEWSESESSVRRLKVAALHDAHSGTKGGEAPSPNP